ncbi:hypothetical protein [Nocardia thraciensis]
MPESPRFGPTHHTAAETARKLTEFYAAPNPRQLPGIASALRG